MATIVQGGLIQIKRKAIKIAVTKLGKLYLAQKPTWQRTCKCLFCRGWLRQFRLAHKELFFRPAKRTFYQEILGVRVMVNLIPLAIVERRAQRTRPERVTREA